MPEQQIPAEDRPSSSSSSEPAGGSLGHSPEEVRGETNNNENQFVAIRNLINSNRSTTRHRPRPPVPRLPFESFIPTPMRYYPIVIPAEPTIEDLLRQAAGTAELHRVTEIKLKVISHMTSLQRIPFFIPNLRSLTLEGSIVMTLRDLGCDMTSLVYLNVSRCSLKNLDGTSGLETLEELVADHNQIEEVGPCTNLVQIKKISLKSNRITDLGSITFLALCESLEHLDLRENFVSENPSFRHMLKENIPQLRSLNEIPFSEAAHEDHTDMSSSEYQSSSSSIEGGQPNNRWDVGGIGDGAWNERNQQQKQPFRPTTSHQERTVTVELLDDARPATAGN
uniref:Protein phosphatase 1 regulatory subunit n=1 Tax=Culex tarsalis TaxID=7177 RepID=A0A1Q3FT77_CULTA